MHYLSKIKVEIYGSENEFLQLQPTALCCVLSLVAFPIK